METERLLPSSETFSSNEQLSDALAIVEGLTPQARRELITTGEQKDRQKVLSSLFQIFQVVAQNPNVLQNPTMGRLFNEIMETAGVSPALIRTAPTRRTRPRTERCPQRAPGCKDAPLGQQRFRFGNGRLAPHAAQNVGTVVDEPQ